MSARSKALARLELFGSSLAFGAMAVLARRLSRGPGAFTAGHLSVIRFVVGAAASLLVFAARPGLFQPRDHRRLVGRGLSGGVVVVLYFLALARIPAGEAGLLYNLFPVIATGMSMFTLGERPGAGALVGLAAATAGVALVLGRGTLTFQLGAGQAFALGSAIFAATSANIIRGMRATDNAPTIFFFFCVAGLPVVVPFALDPWPWQAGAWGVAVAMGLCAFAAQVLMTEAYGVLSVSEAAVWLQLTPLVQFLLAVPLLGEPIGLVALGGALLCVAGVAYGTVRGRGSTSR